MLPPGRLRTNVPLLVAPLELVTVVVPPPVRDVPVRSNPSVGKVTRIWPG